MLNKQQEKDADLCEEMEMNGEQKDCFGCSCNVCLAQTPDLSPRKAFRIFMEFTLKDAIKETKDNLTDDQIKSNINDFVNKVEDAPEFYKELQKFLINYKSL